jgi:hypothetical protein
MNKNNQKIALVSGLIIAIGATIYFLRKNRVSEKELEEEEEKEIEEVKVSPSASFLTKAKALQTALGFKGDDVDGIIGDNTKGRLAVLGITTTINASNIDSVIGQVNSKNRENAKLQKDKSAIKPRVERAKQVTSVLPKNRKLTWIDNDVVLSTFKKDLLGKLVKQSAVQRYKKNEVIDVVSWKVNSSGFIEVFTNNRYVVVSPYSVSVFN